jgi:DNA-binding protein YbaB
VRSGGETAGNGSADPLVVVPNARRNAGRAAALGEGFDVVDRDLVTEQARVAVLREQAGEVLSGLRDRLAAVREAQRDVAATTGTATSRDGGVRAEVDATGVVTALVFAPTAFERSTPERLAQTAVATIQAAAAQARARVSETMAPVRASGSGMLAAAAAALPELDPNALSVPPVPRTATDPTESADPWGQPQQSPPADRSLPEDDGESGYSLRDSRGW